MTLGAMTQIVAFGRHREVRLTLLEALGDLELALRFEPAGFYLVRCQNRCALAIEQLDELLPMARHLFALCESPPGDE